MPKFEIRWTEERAFKCSAIVEAADEKEARRMWHDNEVFDHNPVDTCTVDSRIQKILQVDANGDPIQKV
jgi:hypothetical protein